MRRALTVADPHASASYLRLQLTLRTRTGILKLPALQNSTAHNHLHATLAVERQFDGEPQLTCHVDYCAINGLMAQPAEVANDHRRHRKPARWIAKTSLLLRFARLMTEPERDRLTFFDASDPP